MIAFVLSSYDLLTRAPVGPVAWALSKLPPCLSKAVLERTHTCCLFLTLLPSSGPQSLCHARNVDPGEQQTQPG